MNKGFVIALASFAVISVSAQAQVIQDGGITASAVHRLGFGPTPVSR